MIHAAVRGIGILAPARIGTQVRRGDAQAVQADDALPARHFRYLPEEMCKTDGHSRDLSRSQMLSPRPLVPGQHSATTHSRTYPETSNIFPARTTPMQRSDPPQCRSNTCLERPASTQPTAVPLAPGRE